MKRSTSLNRQGQAALMLLILLVGISTALARVWTHLSVIDYGYKITKATTQQRTLKERNRRLRIELALLKRPERVVRLAAAPLGLRPATPEQTRRLREPGVRQRTGAGAARVAGIWRQRQAAMAIPQRRLERRRSVAIDD